MLGLTGKGVEDSLMTCPSMMWVTTWGFTTALGVTVRAGGSRSGSGWGARGSGGDPAAVMIQVVI